MPTDEQLAEILEAGRWAPTAFNKQPQRVFILETEEALTKMDQVHPCRYGAKLELMRLEGLLDTVFPAHGEAIETADILADHLALADGVLSGSAVPAGPAPD